MRQEQLTGAYLVVQKTPMVGKRIELWKDCTTIGRSRNCDIFLEDIAVHRQQASILRTQDGYVLRDDHGSGDSFVNGCPIGEQQLNSGDQLLFGNTQMTFYANEGTRPFQLPVSRGREMHEGRPPVSQPLIIASLEHIDQSGMKHTIELLPEMTIGRRRDCSIFLEDLQVSRLHATIREQDNGSYELLDNQSATGTFVNGRAIIRHMLIDHDIIQIGMNRFIFHLVSA